MNRKYKLAFFAFLAVWIILLFLVYWNIDKIAVLNPKGIIGLKQRDLMAVSTALMLIVVIPVFVLTIYICWVYRASNPNANYTPDWNHSLLAEAVWWGLPFTIVLLLSILTWKSTHELDPYKPIKSDIKPLVIQVVALQWKWLFIYPEQNIATVNFIQFPQKTPITFEITADAPMNSFWIPELGGQIYAMPGMKTQLNLIADEIGRFRGSSANISGKGFSGMVFIAESSSSADFDQWVQSVRHSPNQLDMHEYQNLVKPSEYDPVTVYSLQQKDLFEQIVMKSMPYHIEKKSVDTPKIVFSNL
jgi:cytochrome o ubiquinol oxidase subunit 2